MKICPICGKVVSYNSYFGAYICTNCNWEDATIGEERNRGTNGNLCGGIEMEKDCMEIPLKDIYQLLIAECRYGYTRNNHLMPSGAFDRVKEYLPKMYEIDEDFAVSTARQICEEAISDELLIHFRNGVDDQHRNMWETIHFVEWLRAWLILYSQTPNNVPYNYSQYVEWFHETFNTEPPATRAQPAGRIEQ